MFNVPHVLDPAMVKGLATYLAVSIRSRSAGLRRTAPPERSLRRRTSQFRRATLAGCHGPHAKGDGAFPRLAGQLHYYIARKLTNWDNERRQDPANPDTSAIMQPIAHSLTQSQIAAVAAYPSNLE